MATAMRADGDDISDEDIGEEDGETGEVPDAVGERESGVDEEEEEEEEE
jgi:hypothetical protein